MSYLNRKSLNMNWKNETEELKLKATRVEKNISRKKYWKCHFLNKNKAIAKTCTFKIVKTRQNICIFGS